MDSLEKQFVERMRKLLVELPWDTKVMFEAMSDENLPDSARIAAAGAAIYCLSPSDPIPDSAGILGFVDDVVVVKLSLRRLLDLGGEDAATYPERFVEQFNHLDEDLELIRGYLGERMEWLEERVKTRLHKAHFKGKDAAEYVADEEAMEYLYDEGRSFRTDYEIDETEARKLHSGESVREVFARRMHEENRRIDR